MSKLRSLRQSNLARYATYGLIILWYSVFVLGTLLKFGFGGGALREQGVDLAIASVVFIVLLAITRWFFETSSP